MIRAILILFLFSFSVKAEDIHDYAKMVSAIERVKITCSNSGSCIIKGDNTAEAERIMVEVVGPGLTKEGWNGRIRIKKRN